MKISKQTNTKNKLIKLKLIKTKIYKSNSENSTKINDIIPRIKKAIFLIYKYHINNKRILFVGTPMHSNKKLQDLLKNTKHTSIPESVWVNGIITNKKACFKDLTKDQTSKENKILEILFPLRKKSDLIVILDSVSNQNVLKEASTTETPTITLNNNLGALSERFGYNIPGNFTFTKKKKRDDFFYSLLNTTFKKAKRVKNYLNKFKNKKPTTELGSDLKKYKFRANPPFKQRARQK